MPETVESKPVKADASNDKMMAAVATLPLVGLIMFYVMKDASPIVKHYAKQSNAVLALNIAIAIIATILVMIPVVGCIAPILYVLPLVAWILVLVKALNGDEKYLLPVIGEFFDKLLK